MTDLTPFAMELASRRERERWTQAELAARCGLSRDTINKLENGRRRPTPRTLVALRHPFNMSLEELQSLANRKM